MQNTDNEMNQVEVWKSTRRLAISKLNEVATKLDKVENDVNKAKIAGSATSIVFGIGSVAAGIAALFTFGVAIPVAIGLGVVASAGGVTVGGSVLVKIIIEKTNLKDVQEILDKDIELTKCMKTTLEKTMLFGDIALAVAGKANAALHITAIIGKSVVRTIANVGDDAVVAACGAFATMSNVARIADPIISLAIVSFYVYILVTTAIAVDKKKPSAVAEDFRKRAREMQKELDAIEEWNDSKEEGNCYFDILRQSRSLI